MRRILLVMNQPPGCSGVQALIYNKILPFTDANGWELHFAGPAPWLCSVITESLPYPPERLHYTTNVSPSLRFSVRKNRHPKSTLPYLVFGGLQWLARTLEKICAHNSEAFLLRGLENTIRQAERRWGFDLIAGKSPDFKILELVGQLTHSMGKPFVALVDDPYGARDESGFYPKSPELQRQILSQSRGVIFMSPLTRQRYVEAGLVEASKAHCQTDSYPEGSELYASGRSPLARRDAGPAKGPLRMVYLGMLPEWRPIEPFLEAFHRFSQQPEHEAPPLSLDIFGFVYGQARQRIQSNATLAQRIHLHSMVAYAESHWLAEDADIQLVVIGPRHLDNYPSKFFDYLAHNKPVLVLGPPQNPLRHIVEDLAIGLYVDGRSSEDILVALHTLQNQYPTYKNAYLANAQKIEAYSAHQVAANFCRLLDQCQEGGRRSAVKLS